ncbi:hypothetical protein DMH04_50680 [Kibdelosporangium aridum]|uniref:PPE family protein n=1 Tax=Kibdelosporangium aridum TaxID=2030 RepID=A0A428YB71_KIBAR|nr:hypothetical protein [Kibdelosporangium aridum]RSM64799.1 hypothetical protein DMH04_50680 [Kibdelosporangium aridum]
MTVRAPLPWPKPEPQPTPGEDALYDNVDWMTFTHEQLYEMVHQGIDVSGANAVAAKWAMLGAAMQEIGDELAKALAASLEAWQGAAADQARGSLAALSAWSTDAGVTAKDVSALVAQEASNAENARRNMPEPVATFRPDIPIPANATSPMSAAFESAVDIVKDPHGPTHTQHAAHQEAAQVMQQFQTASQEVYGTVPQFAPPDTRGVYRLPESVPPTPPPQQPQPPQPPPVPPVAVPPPTRGPVVAGGSGPVSPVSPVSPVQPPPAARPPAAPVGAAVPPPVEESRPAPRVAPAASAGGGGMSMSPVGMAGGASKEEDQERKAPKYLEGDPELFRIADRLAPPVIGEDNGGA